MAAGARPSIEALRAKVVAYAVDAYVSPPDEDLIRRFEAGSAQEDATKRALLEMQSGKDVDVLDQLRGARRASTTSADGPRTPRPRPRPPPPRPTRRCRR